MTYGSTSANESGYKFQLRLETAVGSNYASVDVAVTPYDSMTQSTWSMPEQDALAQDFLDYLAAYPGLTATDGIFAEKTASTFQDITPT